MRLTANIAIVFLALFLVCSVSGQAKASKKPENQAISTHHYCSDEDVIGNYYVLALTSENMNMRFAKRKQNVVINSYLAFLPNNYYSYSNGSQIIFSRNVMNQALSWIKDTKASYRYVIGKKGDIAFFKDKEIVDRYQCIAVNQNTGDYKAGDIILTTYPIADSDYKMIKLYRVWIPITP